MIGLVLFMSTTVFFSNQILLLPFALLLLGKREWPLAIVKEAWPLVAILTLVALNRLIGILAGRGPEDLGLKSLIPYQGLFLVSYLLGRSLARRDLEVFVLLICAEVAMGFLEYKAGTTSFFHVRDTFSADSLLYYRRVAGMSDGVSVFAQKILVAILLWQRLKPGPGMISRIASLLALGCLVAGLYFTFNRTAIACAGLYAASLGIRYWYRNRKSAKALAVVAAMALGLALSLWHWGPELQTQFFRGAQSFSLEGRGEIWNEGADFLNQHPLAGNHSFPLRMDLRGSRGSHFHNSMLQMSLDNGLGITLILSLWLLLRINRGNWPEFLVFVAYSMLQYGLFWGLSFFDVFFYMFLFARESPGRARTFPSPDGQGTPAGPYYRWRLYAS